MNEFLTLKNSRFRLILEVCQELVYGFVNHKKLALLGINWYRLPLAIEQVDGTSDFTKNEQKLASKIVVKC